MQIEVALHVDVTIRNSSWWPKLAAEGYSQTFRSEDAMGDVEWNIAFEGGKLLEKI